MQSVTGIIVGDFTQTGEAAPEVAYRAVFGFLALMTVISLLLYLPARDRQGSVARAAGSAAELQRRIGNRPGRPVRKMYRRRAGDSIFIRILSTHSVKRRGLTHGGRSNP